MQSCISLRSGSLASGAAVRPRPVRQVKLACFRSAKPANFLVPAAPQTSQRIAVTPVSVPSKSERASLQVTHAAASSAVPVNPPAQPFKWGCNIGDLLQCVAIGALIWFIPAPAGVTEKAWHLLAVFVATIVGIIKSPFPGGLGSVAMVGLGAAMLLKVLTFGEAFSAFATEIPWLIAIAYWLAGAFIKSGLGNRVAYSIVSLFGKTTLGLTYSLVFAEALTSPAIPSVAARAGGIFFPLAKALCLACGSDPEKGTAKSMGSYLMVTCFQATCVSSAMFITAMAANPLAVNLAASVGVNITWGTWAMAGIVPGLFSLIFMPLLLYALYPPEQKNTPDAPAAAKAELERLGPMSRNEKITAAAFLVTVSLWIGGGALGISSVASALVGFTILIVTGVITWKECLGNGGAWDTLTWFAALIAMAAYLNKFGLIKWFSDLVVTGVSGFGLSWAPAFALISVVYFYTHYFFASGAAHIGAMYTAFLAVATASGAPPLLAALALGQFSNLFGCLTTYGIGSAPPYFGAGYVPQADWLKLGFICSIFYLSVWAGIGAPWWKFLGLW